MRYRCGLVVLVLLLSLAACQSPPAAETHNDHARAGIFSVAVTIDPKLKGQLAGVLAGQRQTIRLEIDQLQLPEDLGVSYRIFLNEPGATERTPTSRPSYLAAIPGKPFSDAGAPRNLVFDAFSVLKGLQESGNWTPGNPIAIQFVAAPFNPLISASVKSVRLSLP